ncbi:MAG: hypothetical protein ACFCUM_10540 [Bacteroidales bacterium]
MLIAYGGIGNQGGSITRAFDSTGLNSFLFVCPEKCGNHQQKVISDGPVTIS